MAWKFLNIGKANTEIERLNAEIAKKDKELAEAKAAPPKAAPSKDDGDGDNDTDEGGEYMECEACNATGKCAECSGSGECAECMGEGKMKKSEAEARAPKGNAGKLAVKLDEMAAKQAESEKAIANLQGQVSAKDAEIKALNEKLTTKDSEVKVQVARQALNTQANLGQPGMPVAPATATNGTSQLKGVARMREAIKTQLDKDFPLPNRQ